MLKNRVLLSKSILMVMNDLLHVVSIIRHKIINLYHFLKADVDLFDFYTQVFSNISFMNGGCWLSMGVIFIWHLRQIHDTTVLTFQRQNEKIAHF